MTFEELGIEGVFLIKPDLVRDDRGFFARVFCAEEFGNRDLTASFPQCSISFNRSRGTLRGLHFQAVPHEEAKIVRCIQGALFDVAVDLRPASPTFGRWASSELTAENRHALYIPKGFAHGFLTLSNMTEVYYQISTPYVPHAARGIRWNDPAVGVRWPEVPSLISQKDADLPLLSEFDFVESC